MMYPNEGQLRDELKNRESLKDQVLARVRGGVWHTTNNIRFQGILASGAILPEPGISDSERWGTSQGQRWYPYVRTLGGVSLFDLRDFDPAEYSAICPISTWWEFIPYRTVWQEAVWIELDTKILGQGFISGGLLLDRWKADKAGNRIMPHIEAAHIGPIPLSAFKSGFAVRSTTPALLPVEWQTR